MVEYTLSEIFGIISVGGVLLGMGVGIVYAYWLVLKLVVTNIKEEPVHCIMLLVLLFIISSGILSFILHTIS